MKKLLCFLLIGTLAAVLLTGCGKRIERDIPVREVVFYGYEEARPSEEEPDDVLDNSDEANQSVYPGSLMESITKMEWPAEKLPAELPQYADGRVANTGGEADDFVILVENTSPEALTQYVEALTKAGWIVTGGDAASGGEAVQGIYTINFQWNNSASTFLQIDVYTREAGEWPYDDIPPDILPPKTGTMVEAPTVINSGEGMWYFNFTLDGMNEDAAADYMQMLIANGWSGDTSFVSKEFDWNGKKYSASIEIYEIIETRSTFTCNFGNY